MLRLSERYSLGNSEALPEFIRNPGLIEVRGVTKRFRAVTALDGVSFGIRRGEVLVLIGPNGAGKTTLFECLAGELPADEGEVFWNGSPMPATRRKEAL